MAGAALGAKVSLPFVHYLVNLVAGHGLGQDLQVRGWRHRTVAMLVFVGRWRATGGLLG